MKPHSSQNDRYSEIPKFSFAVKNLLSWQYLAVLAVIGCALIGVFQYFSPTHTTMALAYLLYPASLCMLALMVYTRRYIAYFEIKLLGALFIWMIIVTLLNAWRADAALSSTWFHSVCVTTFLCFSIPYAFRADDANKAFSIIAAVMVVSISLLSAAGLFYVLAGKVGNIATAPGGVFGIGADNRLHMFCHPNTVAPICGGAIVVSGYLFAKQRNRFTRIALIAGAVLCYAALALTDSRAGIISTAFALGFEAFLAINAKLFQRRKAALRLLLSLILSAVLIIAFYQGSVLMRAGYNHIAVTSATAQAAADNTAESAESVDSSANTGEQVVSSRGLADIGTFNKRTDIWRGVLNGLKGERYILLLGTTPLASGDTMAQYFPKDSPIGNFHNSLLAILVALGIPGLLIVLVLLVLLMLACIRLSFSGMTDTGSLAERMVPAVLIFTLAESMMESFLFTAYSPNIVWVLFMLAAGYVFRMQRKNDLAMKTESIDQ